MFQVSLQKKKRPAHLAASSQNYQWQRLHLYDCTPLSPQRGMNDTWSFSTNFIEKPRNFDTSATWTCWVGARRRTWVTPTSSDLLLLTRSRALGNADVTRGETDINCYVKCFIIFYTCLIVSAHSYLNRRETVKNQNKKYYIMLFDVWCVATTFRHTAPPPFLVINATSPPNK